MARGAVQSGSKGIPENYASLCGPKNAGQKDVASLVLWGFFICASLGGDDDGEGLFGHLRIRMVFP